MRLIPSLMWCITNARYMHIHTRLEHSRSNSKETRRLMVTFWTLTSVTLKSRSNRKSWWSIFGFGPLVAKPRITSDRNLVCEVIWPSGTYMESFMSIAPEVTKWTMRTDNTWSHKIQPHMKSYNTLAMPRVVVQPVAAHISQSVKCFQLL
jgi:hypothetical protein